jgi:hypothetical protein
MPSSAAPQTCHVAGQPCASYARQMRCRCVPCVAVLSSLLTLRAGAQTAGAAAPASPEARLSTYLYAQAPARRDPTVHRHDGFYLRVANGFGVYDERLTSDDVTPYGGQIRSRTRGVVALGELAIGGTIARGWVLGGGIYSGDLIASTFRANPDNSEGATPPAELDPGLRSLTLIGPFFDWYARDTGGFHIQGAIGLATLTPQVFGDAATQESKYLALGGGFMFGAGYDWWVADQFSLGILARTTAVLLQGTDDQDVGWTHLGLTSPGLLVTLTYQ